MPAAPPGLSPPSSVGTGITVTVAGLTISGAQAGDYTLTQPTTYRQHHPGRSHGLGHHGREQGLRRRHDRRPQHGRRGARRACFGGDTVELDTAAATGNFASASVGTGITVTVSGLALPGPRQAITPDPADNDGQHHAGHAHGQHQRSRRHLR